LSEDFQHPRRAVGRLLGHQHCRICPPMLVRNFSRIGSFHGPCDSAGGNEKDVVVPLPEHPRAPSTWWPGRRLVMSYRGAFTALSQFLPSHLLAVKRGIEAALRMSTQHATRRRAVWA
jgi:hypothetical protein